MGTLFVHGNPRLRSLCALTTIIGIGSFFSGLALFEHYKSVVPHESHPAQGRIFKEDDHGTFFYLTPWEHTKFILLTAGGWGLLAASGLIHYAYLRTDRKSSI